MLRVYKSTYENVSFRTSFFSENGDAKDSPEFVVVIGYPEDDDTKSIDWQKIHIKFPYTKEFKKYAYESMNSQSSINGVCARLVAKRVVREEGTLDWVYMNYDERMMLLRLNYDSSTTFFFLERTDDVYTNNSSFVFNEFPSDIFEVYHIISPRKDLYYFTYNLKYKDSYEEPKIKSVDFSGEFPIVESYDVIRYDVYRDSGTTDIVFKQDDNKHNIHIPTPLMGDNRIITLDGSTMCRIIDRNNDADEYDDLVEKISNVCGLKFFKRLRKYNRKCFNE